MLNVPVGQYFAKVAITAVKGSHIKHVVATCIFLFYLSQYPADGNDKTWLYDNKHLPVHGGKVGFRDTW